MSYLHLLTNNYNTTLNVHEIEDATLDLKTISPLIRGITVLEPVQKLVADLEHNDKLEWIE